MDSALLPGCQRSWILQSLYDKTAASSLPSSCRESQAQAKAQRAFEKAEKMRLMEERRALQKSQALQKVLLWWSTAAQVIEDRNAAIARLQRYLSSKSNW